MMPRMQQQTSQELDNGSEGMTATDLDERKREQRKGTQAEKVLSKWPFTMTPSSPGHGLEQRGDTNKLPTW
jgi:hypothetical protein